jgi:serine/threonine protein kinase
MAPELHMGDDDYGFPVDVYAYGMLLYVMLTDIWPFQRLNSYALGKAVAGGDRPAIPLFINDWYRELIQRCWD